MNNSKLNHPPVIQDCRGKNITLPDFPARIISLVPSITETLIDFGLKSKLAGRTRFCIKPECDVADIETVGGPKDPDIDRISELGADLVLANREENSKTVIETMETRGIPVFVTYPKTVVESLAMLKDIAALTGSTYLSDEIISKTSDLITNPPIRRKPARFICLIWKNPWMTVNSDTYIHDIITFCGGENVFAGLSDRYPEITVEEITGAGPDLIILPSEPYSFTENDREELKQSFRTSAPVIPRIITAEGEMFSWYGSRMCQAIPYIQGIINQRIM